MTRKKHRLRITNSLTCTLRVRPRPKKKTTTSKLMRNKLPRFRRLRNKRATKKLINWL